MVLRTQPLPHKQVTNSYTLTKSNPPPTQTKKRNFCYINWVGHGDTNTFAFYINQLLMGGNLKRFATKQDVEEMFNGSNYSAHTHQIQ